MVQRVRTLHRVRGVAFVIGVFLTCILIIYTYFIFILESVGFSMQPLYEELKVIKVTDGLVWCYRGIYTNHHICDDIQRNVSVQDQ